MAKPFDEQFAYPAMSNVTSQTSLGGSYDEYGQSWSSKRGPKEKKQRPRLPKIKSSPSNGALATARTNHERLHKRGNSASATPTSPTYVPDYLLQTAGSSIPASAHAAPYSPIEDSKTIKSKAKIKPLLQKFSSQDQVTIDLSRSAAENEGLGVYANSESVGPIRSASGSTPRGYHHRATSATSQISTTTTSSNRPGAQYVHPMRQTPRPYTPPIAGSYTTSLESETLTHSHGDDSAPTPYAPLPAARRNITSPPHVHTGSSFTNSSQTNLPGTPSSLRFPAEVNNTSDMMVSPTTGRTSLESAFRKRSRSNTTQTDPAQQAATVQQLRKQFQEKEAAKERKYQEAEMKAAEKEQRRREKREEDERRTSEKKARKRARSNAASEKSSLGFGREERLLQSRDGFPAIEMFPNQGPPVQLGPPPSLHRKQRSRGGTEDSKGKAVRGQWALFWFRVRTMWLRLRRKMSGKGGEA